MKTSIEPLEGNKVKVSVEVEEAEFERAIDAAFRRIAREVRIPGFRPGKAPRRLIEARLGAEAAREEALRESLPEYYAEAVKEHELDAIAPPDIDITAGKDSGAVAFDAVVEVRPQVNVAGYGNLRVTVPRLEPTDEEVNDRLDRLREQFGELTSVSRPARDRDHVSVDIRGYRHSESIEGLGATDFLYEVGSGSVVPELDEQLRGAKAGDILKFNATAPDGEEATFQVLVKDVREKILPEVTDEWASEASEFETVDELVASIRQQLSAVRRLQVDLGLREKVVEALVELVDEEAPEPLVGAEMERRAQDLAHRLEHRGADIATYLEASGRSQDALLQEIRNAATQAVMADLALRAVADAEGLEASDDDVENEIAAMAERLDLKPTEVRRRLERGGQLPAVRSDVRKSHALKWLLDHTEIVDEDGQPIDRSLLSPPPEDPSGGGHQSAKEIEE